MKNILRWIVTVPASFLAYAVIKSIQTISALPFLPDLVGYLNTHRDFGPHTIMGPLFAIYREAVPTALAMLVAQKVAPAGNRRRALIVTAGVWVILGVISLATTHSHPAIPQGIAFRTYLEMFAEGAGIVIAFGYKTNSGAQR